MWIPTNELMHSRGPWKRHKYVRIDANGNYIYPNDVGPLERHKVTKANARIAEANQRGMKRTMDERSAQARRDVEAARQKEERNRQAKAAASRYQRQGIKKTGSEKERAREKAIAARGRENLNDRNLNAARNKAARKAGAKRIAGENAERARRSARLRDQRNAEGRLAARKQIKAGNQRSRDEAARLRKLNAINATRKAQKQGMKRTNQLGPDGGALTALSQYEKDRNASLKKYAKQLKSDRVNNRNLEAARTKALRNQRNVEGRAAAKRQITEGNKRAARNVEGRQAARKQIKNANIRSSVRKQGQAVQNNDREQTSKSKAWLYGQNPKNATARKNQNRARIEEAAYKAGYKVRKTAKNAGKSISARARAAWNSASSYKDRFSDYKSFLKWYTKYGIGRYNK